MLYLQRKGVGILVEKILNRHVSLVGYSPWARKKSDMTEAT